MSLHQVTQWPVLRWMAGTCIQSTALWVIEGPTSVMGWGGETWGSCSLLQDAEGEVVVQSQDPLV